jgi:hypothetical protein
MGSIFAEEKPDAALTGSASACVVGTYDRCPSTRVRDPQTMALSRSFDALLVRIDDDMRRAGACEAWRAAATWCDNTTIYVPTGQDAGSQ